MEVVRPAYAPLVIDGLSYSDWEDDADRLRQVATGSERVAKKHVGETERLLASLQEELDAIDSVSPGLSGFDAVRVACVRDLIVALRISLAETQRMLLSRMPKRAPRAKKSMAAAESRS